MTTIAGNRRCLAGDSKVTGSKTALYHTDKIFRIRESIVGVAGEVSATTKWLAWFRKGCPEVEDIGLDADDDDDDGMYALVLNAEGLFLYVAMTDPDLLHNKFYAVGSGSMVAMAMMGRGFSPAEAVKEASKYDECTGGPVKVLALADFTPAKSKTKFQRPTKAPKAKRSEIIVQDSKIQTSNTKLTSD